MPMIGADKAMVLGNSLNPVVKNTSSASTVPQAMAASEGYVISQQKRKWFGWGKSVNAIRQVLVWGLRRVDQMFVLPMTIYNPRDCVRWDGVHPMSENGGESLIKAQFGALKKRKFQNNQVNVPEGWLSPSGWGASAAY